LTAALAEPFAYAYMVNAMWVSALVGGVCAFLSAYLMLKGWSLIGDALSHSIVPGVAGAFMLGLPFSFGAFLSGGLAAAAMLFLNQRTKLKEDAIIGIIFTSFFGLACSWSRLADVRRRADDRAGQHPGRHCADTLQLVIIAGVSLAILLLKVEGPDAGLLRREPRPCSGVESLVAQNSFFTLLAACTVAALQTVGAFLVIALVVTPGATAYLLTDRFPRLIAISVTIGAATSFAGAYSATSWTGRPAA
jgi:manganese/iron transport system permease protein